MVYREHGMWEVLQVLKRIFRGEGRRSIARNTGRSRKTIGRYFRAAKKLGWDPEVKEPDEDLAAAVVATVRPGPRDASPGESERLLLEHKERIGQWLKVDDPNERGLKLTKVHRLLGRKGVTLSYSSLYRFAVKHFDFGRQQSTVRVEDVEPGELAEVDFGRLGLVPDPDSGRRRVLHALVVTLVFSRHQYVHLTHTQKLEDFIDGLEDAWEFFGGVVARVVMDNLKAAVLKADRYDPIFQRIFDEYADYRGFVIDSTVSGHAKGKPHVERQVPYVRENFFRGEEFLSREHAQQEVIQWCLTTAGLRIHGTTRKQPLIQFETFEKSALNPIEKERFDTPQWAEPKIHPDYHVRFNYALYSVPHKYRGPEYRGKKVTLRADSKLVRIYVDGRLARTHATQPPGGRSTYYEDYPPEKSPYAMRDADYLIEKARKRGEYMGVFAELLLSGTFPWAKLRQAQKLLRLSDKYGHKRLDDACKRALDFDIINVHRVERIVVNALESAGDPSQMSTATGHQTPVVQLPLRFLRDAQSFNHSPRNRKEDEDGSQSVP